MPAATIIQLLGCFQLAVDGREVRVPLQAQRVVAFLAVNSAPIGRHRLAERLWPFSGRERAQANLRTALWRVRRDAPQTLHVGPDTVHLGAEITVDSQQLLDPGWFAEALTDAGALVGHLRGELLPGWDEDWLTIERERVRQLRMRRLEDVSRRFLAGGGTAEAIDAAYASIEIEPLRESAHLALIEAHVGDGNVAEAAHQVERVGDLLRDELGIAPSEKFRQRVAELGLRRRARGNGVG